MAAAREFTNGNTTRYEGFSVRGPKQLLGRLFCAALLQLSGCHPAPSVPGPNPSSSESSDARGESSTTWESLYMQGVKIGHGWTRTSVETDDGQTLRHIHSRVVLRLKRFDDETEQAMDIESRETMTGDVQAVTMATSSNGQGVRCEGHREGEHLVLSAQSPDAPAMRTNVQGVRGFFAIEQSLQQHPMVAGEKREFRALLPLFSQVVVAEVRMEAGTTELTELIDRQQELTPIDVVMRFGPSDATQQIEQRMWTDGDGQLLKIDISALDQTSYRVTENEAMRSASQAFDLGMRTTIAVPMPYDNIHGEDRAGYAIRMTDHNPAEVFFDGPLQRVTERSEHEAIVEVTAADLAQEMSVEDREQPTEADRRPNRFIESTDAAIVAEAQRVAPGETDLAKVAYAMEAYVHGAIEQKNYADAFATAKQVAQSRSGDCTEHAVFLAALCRAREIPARVVLGLVYVRDYHGFAGHMWNEVWIGDRWLPLDATLGRPGGGIGVGHLKLAAADLDDSNIGASFLSILPVLKGTEIEVISE